MSRWLTLAAIVILWAYILLVLVGGGEAAGSGPECAWKIASYWDRDYLVPGMITEETWRRRVPPMTSGTAVYYAPGIMEATAKWRGYSLDGYVGAVALQTPAHLGESVWLKYDGEPWEGPFLVADTSHRCHTFVNAYYLQIVAEVDFKTAERWGMVRRTERGFESLDPGVPIIMWTGSSEPPRTFHWRSYWQPRARTLEYALWFADGADFELPSGDRYFDEIRGIGGEDLGG